MDEYPGLLSLLDHQYRSSHDLAKRVLAQLVRAIGAHCGFIGLIERQTDRPSIVVRDKLRVIADHGVWNHQPDRFQIGARALPKDERSFTGLVAFTRRARRSGDVNKERYYRASSRQTRSEIATPILLNEDLLGVINLQHRSTNFYTRRHQVILEVVARLIAPQLDRLMMGDGIRPGIRHLLEEIDTALQHAPPDVQFPSTVLNHVAGAVAGAIASRSCTIWFIDSRGESLLLEGAVGPHRKYVGRHRQRRGETLAWRAFQEGTTMWLDSRSARPKDSGRLDRMVYGHSVRKPLVVIPILAGGGAIGVIKVGLKRRSRQNPHGLFSGSDVDTLRIVQSRLGLAWAMKQLELRRHEELQKRNRQLQQLVALFRDIDLERALNAAVEMIPELCGARNCSIFLKDERLPKYVLAASKGLDERLIGKASYRPGEGLTGWVALHATPLRVAGRSRADLRAIAPDLHWKAKYLENNGDGRQVQRPFMAAPIMVEGDVAGVVRVGDRVGQSQFTEADLGMLVVVASHLASAVAFRRTAQSRYELLTITKHLPAFHKALLALRHGDDSKAESLRDAALEAAIEDTRHALGADIVMLYQYDPETERFITPPRRAGDSFRPKALGGTLHRHDVPFVVLQDGSGFWEDIRQSHFVRRRRRARTRPFAIRERLQSCAGIRLDSAEQTVGTLFVNYRRRQRFDASQRALIMTAAGHLALAMDVLRLYRILQTTMAREERHYLSGELHAGVLGTLKSADPLCISARKYLLGGDTGRALETINNVRRGVLFTIEEGRELLKILNELPVRRPRLKDRLELLATNLLAATHTKVILRLDDVDVGIDQHHHLYRIAQTALSNVAVHASATKVTIELKLVRDRLRLTIADNGVGFDARTARKDLNKYGLRDIDSRAKRMYGRAEIVSRSGRRGCTVRVFAPPQ